MPTRIVYFPQKAVFPKVRTPADIAKFNVDPQACSPTLMASVRVQEPALFLPLNMFSSPNLRPMSPLQSSPVQSPQSCPRLRRPLLWSRHPRNSLHQQFHKPYP